MVHVGKYTIHGCYGDGLEEKNPFNSWGLICVVFPSQVVFGGFNWNGVEKKNFLLLIVQTSGNHQVDVGSLSHYLPGFLHYRWLFGMSSINNINYGVHVFLVYLSIIHQINQLHVYLILYLYS